MSKTIFDIECRWTTSSVDEVCERCGRVHRGPILEDATPEDMHQFIEEMIEKRMAEL